MRLTKLVFTFLLVCTSFHLARTQTFQTAGEVKKERFTVYLKMGPNNQVAQVSFTSEGGKKLKPTILNPRNLAKLNLQTGTILKGTFRFNQLSGTDLGSSRFYEGWGNFAFDKVMKPNGQLIGCPPLCDEAVRLKVRLKE